MKHLKTSPVKENVRRYRPLRTAVICLILAAALISASVGLSYARYTSGSRISENINFLGVNFVHSDNIVIEYIDRDNTDEPVVLNYNDEVVVTVPRGLSTENTCAAYALIVDSYTGPAYDNAADNYVIDVSVRVVGLVYPSNQNIAEGTVSMRNVALGAKKADVKVLADTGVTAYDFSVNLNNSWLLGYNSPYLILSDVSNLGMQNSPRSIRFTYTKGDWQSAIDGVSAATDWYTEDPNASSYTLESAVQLAGLAKLVNEGTEDFEGKTINLGEDLSLYGSGGVDDRIEWVPIGTDAHPFKGSFDGHGYRISGITVGSGSASDIAGLFGVVEGDPDNPDDYCIKRILIDSAVIYGKANSYVGTVAGKATAYRVSDITASELKISGANSAKIGMVVGQANTGFSYGNCQINALDSDDYDDIGEDNTQDPIEVMEAYVFYNTDTNKVSLKVSLYNNAGYSIDVYYSWFSIEQGGNSYGSKNTYEYQEAAGNDLCEFTFELTEDAQNIDYSETVALYMNGELINDDIAVTQVSQ